MCITRMTYIIDRPMKSEPRAFCITKIAQEDGYHIVHKLVCIDAPNIDDRHDLGHFNGFDEALEKAKLEFDQVKTCNVCNPPRRVIGAMVV